MVTFKLNPKFEVTKGLFPDSSWITEKTERHYKTKHVLKLRLPVQKNNYTTENEWKSS